MFKVDGTLLQLTENAWNVTEAAQAIINGRKRRFVVFSLHEVTVLVTPDSHFFPTFFLQFWSLAWIC